MWGQICIITNYKLLLYTVLDKCMKKFSTMLYMPGCLLVLAKILHCVEILKA